MDTAQWSQKIGLMKPMEDLVTSTTTATVAIAGVAASSSSTGPEVMERTRVRPQKEQALNCPRCNSTNTKFCYYNNYSLTQPRYFCKNCRRYWTAGGSLRNVPVGGGSRKNKRSSSLSSSSSAATSTSSSSTAVAISNASKKLMATDHHLISPAMSLATTQSQAPSFHEGKDLSLAFPAEFSDFTNNSSSRSNTVGSQLSAMDLLRNGMAGRSLGPFLQMPMPMSEYPVGFGLQDQLRRPAALSFSLDGIGAGSGGGYGSMQGVHESDSGGRMVVPFEDLKPAAPSGTAPPDQFQLGGVPPAGFWSGMIGGSGGSW